MRKDYENLEIIGVSGDNASNNGNNGNNSKRMNTGVCEYNKVSKIKDVNK